MVAYTSHGGGDPQTHPDFWIAHSRSHGWVVLDRRLPRNRNTVVPEEMLFVRCRDGKEYVQGDQPWNYRAAQRYLRDLPASEAQQARLELTEIIAEYAA